MFHLLKADFYNFFQSLLGHCMGHPNWAFFVANDGFITCSMGKSMALDLFSNQTVAKQN
jgi:hypothetical protein